MTLGENNAIKLNKVFKYYAITKYSVTFLHIIGAIFSCIYFDI